MASIFSGLLGARRSKTISTEEAKAGAMGRAVLHAMSDALGVPSSVLRRSLSLLVSPQLSTSSVAELDAVFYNNSSGVVLGNGGHTVTVAKGTSVVIRLDSAQYGRFLHADTADGERVPGIRIGSGYAASAAAITDGLLLVSVAGQLADSQPVTGSVTVGDVLILPLTRAVDSTMLVTLVNSTDATNGADIVVALHARAILDDDGMSAQVVSAVRAGAGSMGRRPGAKSAKLFDAVTGALSGGRVASALTEAAAETEAEKAAGTRGSSMVAKAAEKLRAATRSGGSKAGRKLVSDLLKAVKEDERELEEEEEEDVSSDGEAPVLSSSSAPRIQSRRSTAPRI